MNAQNFVNTVPRLITDPHNEAEVKEALDHVCYELRY
jgi:hypothetical protein